MDREKEITNLAPSFRAAIMGEILHYRGKVDALSQVAQFLAAVEVHKLRYAKKLADERAKTARGLPLSKLIDIVESKIREIAHDEIQRAKDTNKVEFYAAY
jgi:hypothetical protein